MELFIWVNGKKEYKMDMVKWFFQIKKLFMESMKIIYLF